MNSSQYVVIGAGLAGASTAWQLAAHGHEVTILERSQPANQWGSSHGSARIFRYAYPDPFYVHLVSEAKKGWDEIERLTGRTVLKTSGALDFGLNHNPAELAGVLTAEGVPNDLLSRDEARSRWPQFAFDSEVLWHSSAAVIDAEGAVMAMLELATFHGARLEREWEVTGVTRTVNGYRLTSVIGQTMDAEHIVVSAGAWLPTLLKVLPLSSSFRERMPRVSVLQEQAFHFPYRDAFVDPGRVDRYSWPAFIHQTDWIHTYGLPGGRDAGFAGQKVAQFNGGKSIGSAEHQDGVVDSANRQRMIDYVERHIPGLVPEPYAETTCLFTNTPTEDFFIDSEENITVLSPCSGHGAKFAPEIGRMTTDFVAGSGDIDDRFRLGAAQP